MQTTPATVTVNTETTTGKVAIEGAQLCHCSCGVNRGRSGARLNTGTREGTGISGEQYAAAVRALAVLITNWQAARAIADDGVGGQLAT